MAKKNASKMQIQVLHFQAITIQVVNANITLLIKLERDGYLHVCLSLSHVMVLMYFEGCCKFEFTYLEVVFHI